MNETPTNQTIRQLASMISWVEIRRSAGLPRRSACSARRNVGGSEQDEHIHAGLPSFRVEPLQSIADDPAVRNDPLSPQPPAPAASLVRILLRGSPPLVPVT